MKTVVISVSKRIRIMDIFIFLIQTKTTELKSILVKNRNTGGLALLSRQFKNKYYTARPLYSRITICAAQGSQCTDIFSYLIVCRKNDKLEHFNTYLDILNVLSSSMPSVKHRKLKTHLFIVSLNKTSISRLHDTSIKLFLQRSNAV